MLRFKAFSAETAQAIETQINEWLKQAEPDVKMMEQSIAPSGALTVGFLFEEGFLASEGRLTEQANAIVEKALHEEPVLEPIEVDQEQV